MQVRSGKRRSLDAIHPFAPFTLSFNHVKLESTDYTFDRIPGRRWGQTTLPIKADLGVFSHFLCEVPTVHVHHDIVLSR